MGSRTIWTAKKKARFLEALAETANVTLACKACNASRQSAYDRRAADPKFKEQWDVALEIGIAALEDEAHRRAFAGFDEPVFYQGKTCGHVRRYSDTLAIFLLKAHRPEKYRERFEHTGAGGTPLTPPEPLSMFENARRMLFLLRLGEEELNTLKERK